MKRMKFIFRAPLILILLACVPLVVSACGGNDEAEAEVPSLCRAYSGFFRIGNVMNPEQVAGGKAASHFLYHYNSVTAENSMKPESVASRKGSFSFIVADNIVNWALENDVEVHGHTLVWHQQSPSWLTKDGDGNPLTRAEARDNMESFINGYVSHFAGRVSSWDVVNEAFTDSVAPGAAWKGALRKDSPWYQAYANGMDEAAGEAPEDYIYDAFVFTRLAAPDALLFYNDFNENERGKRDAIAEMALDLNARWLEDGRNADKGRLLIEVIGMQSHYWTGSLSLDSVRDSIERFIGTGAKVAVTELDIPMGSYTAFANHSDEEVQKQAGLYRGLFDIYLDYSEHIVRVTLWGKADHQSWRRAGSPVLFDGTMKPKPAFWAVVDLPGQRAPADFPWLGAVAGVGAAIVCVSAAFFIRKKRGRRN